jgi:YVTN family beta-propeller protein
VDSNRRHQFLAASIALALGGGTLALAREQNTQAVGPQDDGSYIVSNLQHITPAGILVDLGSPVRAKAVAVNPNTSTKTGAVLLMGSAEPIIIFNTLTGEVVQRYAPPTDSTGSFTGITYSSDGRQLLFSQDYSNAVQVLAVDGKGRVTPGQTIAIPAPTNPNLYSPGVANAGGVAMADGSIGLVAINASNTLGILDLTKGVIKSEVAVGNAPNHVVVKGKYAFVSNEGGRPATSADFTNLSDGTPIVVDKVNASATSGTVSVVDIATGKLVKSIKVGLHPAGMAIDGSTLYVANSYDDTISVIDIGELKVTKTIKVGTSIERGAFGAGANDIAVVGDKAYVTLGQSNAIAVVDLDHVARWRGNGHRDHDDDGSDGDRDRGHGDADEGAVLGYIPTAYFPTSIAYDRALRRLVVADDKGLGTQGSIGTAEGVHGYNTHQDTGVVNLIPLPSGAELAEMTAQVIRNNHWDSKYVDISNENIDPNAAPVPVPAHIGEPSTIKHVFLIIKENRTYDQILGDLPQGNGDPSLAIFAASTPNQHAFIKRFPLLDNVYAPSRQSADGHPWIVSSGSFYSNDIESPDWVRSYPGGNSNDALTYTPKGFIWSQAEKMGLNVKMYGEWSGAQTINGTYTWADFYNTALYKETKGAQGKDIVPDDSVSESTTVPSAAKILDPHYPSFNTGIPDQYRVDYYLPILKRQIDSHTVPNLTIIWLPDDHGSGHTPGYPVPTSAQADNDLALGRIVDAVSHANVWKESAIFVEEDDAQDGVDHVDGHRQPVYIISPYTAAPQAAGIGKVIHTAYTAENINRTIEHILGLKPLTQFDLTVTPMFDAFQKAENLEPFTYVPATTALNLDPNGPISGTGKANLAMDKTPMERAWMHASMKVMDGKTNKADSVEETFLNHVTWYSATDFKRAYPGESKIQAPGPFVKLAKLKKVEKDEDD